MSCSSKVIDTIYGTFYGDYSVSKLIDICSDKKGIQTGPFGSQLHKKDYVDNGTPIVTVEHLGENYLIHNNLPCVSDQDKKRLIKYVLKEGDIVFSRVGSVDRRAYVKKEEDGWLFSGRCLRVRVDTNKIDAKYLSYFFGLTNFKEYIRNIAFGATMPSLNTKLLSNIEIVYPPLLQQKKVSHILSALDEKIEVNNQINKTLENMAQTIFKQWFVDFEFPNEDGEPYKSSGGEMVETELGMIPKGWEVGTISNIGTVMGGGTPSKKRENYYTDNGIPWITPKDLSENKNIFIDRGRLDITESGLKNSSAKLMPKGTVLFSSRAPIGYIAISKNEVTTNQGFKSIIPNQDIGTHFVFQLLKLKKEFIESRASGSTFKEISGGELKKIQIIIPDKKIINKYNKLVDVIGEFVLKNEDEIQNLIKLRDTLLPKLMSGEIRVPVNN